MAEKEKANVVIRYLLFVIGGVLALVLIIAVSMFVFDRLMKYQEGKKKLGIIAKKEKAMTSEAKEVAHYQLKDELTISASNGIVILKVDLAVNNAVLLSILPNYDPMIEDIINRFFINKTVEQIKDDYSKGILNNELLKIINKRLEEKGVMKTKAKWFSKPKKLKIVNLYFTKFLVTKEG